LCGQIFEQEISCPPAGLAFTFFGQKSKQDLTRPADTLSFKKGNKVKHSIAFEEINSFARPYILTSLMKFCSWTSLPQTVFLRLVFFFYPPGLAKNLLA
jgi:hypothetical protein